MSDPTIIVTDLLSALVMSADYQRRWKPEDWLLLGTAPETASVYKAAAFSVCGYFEDTARWYAEREQTARAA